MNFRPNPLLYGANKDFFGTFRIILTMRSAVNVEVLSRAVNSAMARYPYFTVSPVREDNNLVLRFNPRPVQVFNDDRCAVLGSEESCGHLLTFGCKGCKIILDASHYIADGMGIMPVLMTVLYLYVSEMYGTEGLKSEKISMPDEPVAEAEYEYPFGNISSEPESFWVQRKLPENVYSPHRDDCDDNELYSYHLHIPQKAMMKIAQPSDGSPVSFLAVMMYRALCSLDEELNQPVTVHVQHQYRPVLKAFASRHSLVSYIPVVFPPKMKDWDVERQNTVVRGQIIMDSEPEADISAVNRLLTAFKDVENMEYAEKKRAMREFIDKSIYPKTFGISYVGKMDWNGLDKYVEDIHIYLGEKNPQNMILMEVMTIGEDFSVSFMQNGRTRRLVDAFAKQLTGFDIPVRIVDEEKYSVCDTRIPD